MRLFSGLLLLITLISPSVATTDLESGLLKALDSDDKRTRYSAYILAGSINSQKLRDSIANKLPRLNDVELTLALYSLNRPTVSTNHARPFVQSIKTSKDYATSLIDVELGNTTYLHNTPKLQVIGTLAQIAYTDDQAMDKLNYLSRLADGWVAESLNGLIEEAIQYRKYNKNR